MLNLFKLHPDYENRIYGLDVFRAIAILIVVLTHGGFLLTGPLNDFPWIGLPDGVDLFFVLSGFLVGGIFIRSSEKENFNNPNTLLQFWKRRWFRTLPAYYLVLLLNFLFVRWEFIDGNLATFDWSFFVFLQNFSSPLVGFFWESWSLSVEEWFYLGLPLIYILAKDLSSPKRGLLISCFILIIFPLVYRHFSFNPAHDKFWFDASVRKLVVTRIDAIGYGVLAAYFHRYYHPTWIKLRVPAFIVGLGLMFFTIYYPHPSTTYYSQTFFLSIVPLAAVLMIPFAENYRTFRTGIGKFFTHISLISYSMYLINLALVAQVIQKHFPSTSFSNGLIKYVLFWVIVIIGSTLLYKFFEKPIMDLREKKSQPTEK